MFARTLGIDGFALRYQNVYGPGQSLENPYTGLLAVFSNLTRSNRELDIFEDGLESRDFVYIEDVVQATVACLRDDVRGIHVLNVGSGVRTSVLDVANHIVDYFGVSVPIRITGKYRIGDIRHNVADIREIQRLTGFNPVWDFKSGIDQFLHWASATPVPNSGFERSLTELRERGLLGGS